MPAVASIEDLRAAQRDLLEAKDLEELKAAFPRKFASRWGDRSQCFLRQRLQGRDQMRIRYFSGTDTALVEDYPYTLNEIAHHLGIHYATVRNVIAKAAVKVKKK